MSTEADLSRATMQWTTAAVARRYPADARGERTLEAESQVLRVHGYQPVSRGLVNDGDHHVNAGRTLARGVLTGGIGLALFGRSRSKGRSLIHVEFALGPRRSLEEAIAEWSQTLEPAGPDQPQPVASYDTDGLLPDAVEIIKEYQRASASLLQRRLKIGYARAARIIDKLETRGFVGAFDGSDSRVVIDQTRGVVELKTPEPT